MNKTPKLRFKEFSGDWESKKLGETLKIKHGKDQKKIKVDNGIYPILATGGEIGRTNTPLYDKESVLIGRKGTIDRPVYMNTPFWTVDTLFYSEIKKGIFPKFIYYKFQNINWRKYCEASGVPSLSASTIEGIKYNIPSKEEQEKIASFFSLIDDKISLQGEKVEALKDYKKGMMQKIFSRELRFKDDDGRDYPEWQKKKLVDVCNITMGQSPSSSCYNEDKIGLPLIQGNADVKNRKTAPRIYTSEITKTCDIGDIIMSVRAPVGAISKSLHNACIGRGVCSIKPNQSKEYIYQFLLKNEDEWSKISQGSTFESVNSTDIKGLNILIPNLEEQEKIGNFLCDIDLKVEKEKEKLEVLNEYKKGLLQQMFV